MQINKRKAAQTIAAYGVHIFTAIGAVLGLWAILLTFQGYFKYALWVLFAAVIIDSVDGTMARAVKINRYAPAINGALMDNIIDFVTWTVAPLVWFYVVSSTPVWPLLICALASIFGFTNVEAKSDDNFFTGFPSYWNIVVFYLYLLSLPVTWSTIILLIFAISTIIPVRFVYPSKTVHYRKLTIFTGFIFFIQFIGLIILFKESPSWLIYSSFLFPVYYFALSFYLHLKHPRP